MATHDTELNPSSAFYGVPKGTKFNRQQREYQLFPEEFFAAADCQIYFNDVYLEDLTGLSFKLTENTEPIFGYASNTWDYHGRGRRLVQGHFRMAFREAGYMYGIMDHFGQKYGQRKTHLAWLMNNEKRNVYNGYNGAPERTFGQVLESLEDIFTRNHLEKGAIGKDRVVETTEIAGYKWKVDNSPMAIGEEDDKLKAYQGLERDLKGNTTAIRQLQQWLIDNGYGFDRKDFDWKVGYGADTWYKTNTWGASGDQSKSGAKTDKTNQVVIAKDVSAGYFNNGYINNRINKDGSVKAGGRWYMMIRYDDNNKGIGTGHSKYSHSDYDEQLQRAMDRYPGKLDGFFMGYKDVRYDGRYGPNTAKGVRLMMEIANYDDGSNGYWVSERTLEMLSEGLEKPTGVFNFATKLAVYAFQQDMKKVGKLTGSQYPNGKVDMATRDLMTYTRKGTKTVPGASLYRPDEAFESRMALYEKEVWGHRFAEKTETVRTLESFFYRGRRDENDDLYTESLFQQGFDIYINYGPLSHHMKSKVEQYHAGGVKEGTQLGDDVSFNTTVKAIRNIQIYDVEQVIDPNTGDCIEEVYLFIAKDLD